jgi:L-threonylcarbamoyladenylate synthase
MAKPKPEWMILAPPGESPGGRPPWARPAAIGAGIEVATRVLAVGGIVVIPTETFYGLAVLASDAAALARLATVKGRDGHKAMPLVAGTREQVEALAVIPRELMRLADRFWPGPLTLALSPRGDVPPQVLSQNGTLGIRVSSHPIAGELATRAGVISATSANLAGRSPAQDATQLEPALSSACDLVLDAGSCAGALASTVLGLEQGRVVLYRAGAIHGPALASVLGYEPREAAG